ncbi:MULTISPECIES: helix-turn-helix domain-containing protein [unclassified Rathayibacter]|uniref:helix-turn-helix domain-containing protein n=1 Tax=unclassified Rathayibacter TaxID=2609250 RepID=UPI00188C9FDF|nr:MULTISPECIES: helix-turn-helix domain-containing protein [unclassified Rathayibacter]MBF4461146.1 TetR/AcrR family transcriptional regulator [Rathayibacter sp. VKM Ac-2879]MBF4502557.1 TetR/AcrR family transcriptional regulator [Rathayibacter sp. VKM Ac-2878]
MEAARDAIIEAAGATFAAHGYEGASFSRVAQAMGKPKSAIGYHLFPSKFELATAVIRRQQARWVQMEASLEEPAGVERLTAMLLVAGLEIRSTPLAAGAARLLHELLHTDLDIPRDFLWAPFVRGQLIAALSRAGMSPAKLEAGAEHVILEASFGLVTAGRPDADADLSWRLRSLWVPVIEAMGVPDVEPLVAVRPPEPVRPD